MDEDAIQVDDREDPQALESLGCRFGPEVKITAEGIGFKWYADDPDPEIDLGGRQPSAGRIEVVYRDWEIDRLECHPGFEEAFTANFDCCYALAPAGETPTRDNIRLIFVRAGRTVIIGKGVWHFVPYYDDRGGGEPEPITGGVVRVIHPADNQEGDTEYCCFDEVVEFRSAHY